MNVFYSRTYKNYLFRYISECFIKTLHLSLSFDEVNDLVFLLITNYCMLIF